MLTIGQAATAVAGETAARARAYLRLLDARSDLRTLMDAYDLSMGRDPDEAVGHGRTALDALRGGTDPLGTRIRDALHRFGADGPELVVDLRNDEGESDGALFTRIATVLATRADEVLADLRREDLPLPDAFVNLVWMIERKEAGGLDIRLTAVATDRRVQEYVDGMRMHAPGAEVVSERILLDHLYGLRDTVQAMVVGAMMKARGLRRPPRSTTWRSS